MGSLQSTFPQEDNRFRPALQCTACSGSGHLALECLHWPHCPICQSRSHTFEQCEYNMLNQPSNVRPARARAIWPWNALTGHIVRFSSPDLTQSNNVSTTCSTARQPLRAARLSLEIHTHCRTSVNPTEIGIMSDHDHQIVSVVTPTIVVTTTATATTTAGV